MRTERMRKISRNQKGSLTIEACIALTVAIAVSLTISMLLRVVYVQTMMQHAITQTANEIAVYSYYLSATGIKTGMDNLQDATADDRQAVNQQIGAVMDVGEKFNKFSGSLDKFNTELKPDNTDYLAAIEGLEQSLDNAQQLADDSVELVDAGKVVGENLKTIADDPKKALMNFLGAAANVGSEKIKSAALQAVAISFMDKHLSKGEMDSDTHLRKLLVKNGLLGLDFSGTSLFSDQRSVDIIVRYQIKIPSPIPILPEVNIIQRAKANAWLDDGTSIWQMANTTLRGKMIQSEVRNLPPTFTTYAAYYKKDKMGTVTRSLDLSSASYQKKANIKSKINGKIYDIENFTKCTRGDITLEKKDIEKTKFVLYIPRNASEDQKDLFYEALEECKRDQKELIRKNNIDIEVKLYDREV